jgi:hypothetical protein
LKTQTIRWAALAAAFVTACGKPTPEKLCARAAEIAQNLHENECLRDLKLDQENHEKPALYEADVACLTGARNDDAVFECFAARRRRQGKVDDEGKAKDVCAMLVRNDSFTDDAGNDLPPDRAKVARDRALAECIAKGGAN